MMRSRLSYFLYITPELLPSSGCDLKGYVQAGLSFRKDFPIPQVHIDRIRLLFYAQIIKRMRITFLIFQYTALCQWFSRSNKSICSKSSNILFPSIENNRPYMKVHSIPECHNKESRYYTVKYQFTQAWFTLKCSHAKILCFFWSETSNICSREGQKNRKQWLYNLVKSWATEWLLTETIIF